MCQAFSITRVWPKGTLFPLPGCCINICIEDPESSRVCKVYVPTQNRINSVKNKTYMRKYRKGKVLMKNSPVQFR